MADKEQAKLAKEASKNDDVPPIKVSEEASGATKDDGEGGKGLLTKMWRSISPSKRSKSTSPKARKNEPKESDSLDDLKQAKSSQSFSKKGVKEKMKERLSKSPNRKDTAEETAKLCDEEETEHPQTRPAPKEKDMGISSGSPATESMAAKWVTYNKSSSISSVPSDYSSLPDDDCDIGVMSPDDPSSFGDEKEK